MKKCLIWISVVVLISSITEYGKDVIENAASSSSSAAFIAFLISGLYSIVFFIIVKYILKHRL